MVHDSMAWLTRQIRDVPDFPKPGIVFKDITPVLADGPTFKRLIQHWAAHYRTQNIEQVVAIEARGFILGAALAYELGAGLTIVRKPGKLPRKTLKAAYALEYGTDALEIHADAFAPGQRVLILDDVLATGGTAAAVQSLVADFQATLVGMTFLLELGFLKGRDKLKGADVFSLVQV